MTNNPNSERLRILIAEDEAIIRMGLKAMVKSLGYEVAGTAINGSDALEKVKKLKPDLLLLDIKMPVMDGLTTAERLVVECPLPIIMLTAYTEKGLIERAVNASVMGYLVKPIKENKLSPMIEIAWTRFQAVQEAAQQSYQLRDQMEARELIDAAKRILTATGISEQEAYHRMQMAARKKRLQMRQIAEAVISIGKSK